MSLGGTPGVGGALPPGAGIRPPARPEAPAPAPTLAPVAPAESEKARDQLQSAGLDLVLAPGEAGTDLEGLVDDALLQPEVGVLGRGSDPATVRALQSALNALGQDPPLAVDGSYGPQTTAAVRALQEKLGLSPDGQAGPNTIRALQAQEALAMAATQGPEEAEAFLAHAAELIAGIQPEGEQATLLGQLQAAREAQAAAAPEAAAPAPEVDFGNAAGADPAAGMGLDPNAAPEPAPEPAPEVALDPGALAPAPGPEAPPTRPAAEAAGPSPGGASPALAPPAPADAAPAAAEPPPLPMDPASRLDRALSADPAAPELLALASDPAWLAEASLQQKVDLASAMNGASLNGQPPAAFPLNQPEHLQALAGLIQAVASENVVLAEALWGAGVDKAMQDQVPMPEAELTRALVAGMDDASLAALFQGPGAAWATTMGEGLGAIRGSAAEAYAPTLARLEAAAGF